tara:strand:+ start:124 stop:405 length:282 start_codon:yes stop_codon:yes gene_type:complete
MMSHKDCEEWAAMIAQMQDDPSWHPKYNKKGVRPVSNDRGPNDLEQQIETLKFRNEALHKHTNKQMKEIIDLRAKIKKLEHDAVQQFRNKGEL